MAQEGVTTAPFLITIGGSAGSLAVLLRILPEWDIPYPAALLIVLHRKSDADSALVNLLAGRCPWPVEEAEDKQPLLSGHVYIAPPDYHLLIEQDQSFSLDCSEKINYSRPSIDVSFETAAQAYGRQMAGILLSGANTDGSHGLMAIKTAGGITIAQEPATANVPYMPHHAIVTVVPDMVLRPEEIMPYLQQLPQFGA